jgi:hypothetical protein
MTRLSPLDRQVAASSRGKPPKRPSHPRIAVVGNCQSFGIAHAVKLLHLEAEIDRFPVVSKSQTDVETLARTLNLYDHVFLQPFGPGYVQGGTSEAIVAELKNAVVFPTLVFTGYHPDQIFIHDRAKATEATDGPIGPYHSALAFFASRAGFPVEAAVRLFDAEVFGALGYFDVWNNAAETFLKAAQRFSLDLGADLMRWERRGCFMYTSIHPKPYVLFDVARQLMKRAGIAVTPINFDEYAVDDLVRAVVYPVYPQIAEFYGLSGSYVFKGAHFSVMEGAAKFWNLREFVTDSYRFYAKHQPHQLANARVEAWLGDAETCRLLRDIAQPEHGGRSP